MILVIIPAFSPIYCLSIMFTIFNFTINCLFTIITYTTTTIRAQTPCAIIMQCFIRNVFFNCFYSNFTIFLPFICIALIAYIFTKMFYCFLYSFITFSFIIILLILRQTLLLASKECLAYLFLGLAQTEYLF